MVPLHVRGHYRRVQLLSQIISEFNSEKKYENWSTVAEKWHIF